ncbi:arylesterase [Sagittula salina]|uniref:Arylesterase n=1 Tax=Sagittula salina TaxID=2820268 RepID=A0A940MKL6_9RHOB|nr:arylesterase [Sagittula salina]MBP0483236.1 arylesterase [Sagittula salina]
MFGQLGYGVVRGCSKALACAVFLCGSAVQAETVHLLALGDSLTQGYGLMDDEGFVPQLREWLADHGHDARVVNGGVSGDTTAGGLSRVEWSLTPEIGGMIVTLGGNDLLRGIDPAASRANLDGILEVAEAHDLEVLLIGMTAPGNYGAAYKKSFDAMYPELAKQYGTLYLDSFFAGLMTDGETPADVKSFMQSDGIHPNAEGVRRIVDAVGPKVEELIARIED